MRERPYASVIATLGYIARGSRPDIAPTVAIYSQFAALRLWVHWEGIWHLCKYLAATRDYGMVMIANEIQIPDSAATKSRAENDFFPFNALDATPMDDPMQILTFADASHANEETGRRAISGLAIAVGGCIVHWSSKIQKLVALSTMNAETVVTSTGGVHSMFHTSLLRELHIHFYSPTVIANDNAATVSVASNAEHHA
ncbi:hypothetical protein P7C70_g4943, partial [Phenoliferia sp. Uapishka_3]